MELIRALGLDQASKPIRVAFVGAGGKSIAMFQTAKQFPGSVLVTAITHLAVDQIGLADQHFIVDDSLFDQLAKGIPPGLTLFTGPLTSDSARTMGITTEQMTQIYALAEIHHIPLMIEADGSRQRPVKAPADHEPPVPDFVDLVVVVAGLSALGKPLNSEWVHRPEIFTSLSGVKCGENITPEALSKVLTHPSGGLKNIPSHARRIVMLNQADTPELQGVAVTLKSALIPVYDAVIISSMVSQTPIRAVHQSIAAVILAAGGSRRFGSPTQLLDWHGKPLVWHVVQNALQTGLGPVVVVCGKDIKAVKSALEGLPVSVIQNPDWEQGQGTSVSTGVRFIRAQSGGILFMLADQPQIPLPLIHSLVNAHAKSLNPITGPMIDGQRGNPVLFDQTTFDDLASLSGEQGGSKLFAKYPVEWIPWNDPLPLLDVDTPEDYLRLLEMEK